MAAVDVTGGLLPGPDRLRRLPAERQGGFGVNLPPKTASMSVQLTYVDGTKSPLRSFNAPNSGGHSNSGRASYIGFST